VARAPRDARALSARAGFVWDPRLASHVYRDDHPLKPERLIGVYETLRRLGAFERDGAALLAPREATRAEIERVHAPEYVDAVAQASRDPEVDYARWGFSPWGDTPPFEGMHEASLLTTGATLAGMEEVVAGRLRASFNGAGGLHHAMRARASGFCIYNDPAIACGLLADRGMKIAYVDIDAHHGDGVQAAFYDTDRVLTISLHQYGVMPDIPRLFFPGTGTADERGRGAGAGYSVNVPLPPYTDDSAYVRAFDAVVPPLLERYRPDVLVTQQGIDTHFSDPLTHLQVSTRAREHVVSWLAGTPYPWVAMGGGGYSLDAVRRTWAMEYLLMLGATVPDELHDPDPPEEGGERRRAIDRATDQAIREALAASF
jgi:acetoin utilization protein AcuC